jgi:hypothetical protein
LVVLSLPSFICAIAAFPQSTSAFTNPANQPDKESMSRTFDHQLAGVQNFEISEYLADPSALQTSPDAASSRVAKPYASPEALTTLPTSVAEEVSKVQPVVENVQKPAKKPDMNRGIYYRNKLEFSLEGGWLPINIPFPLDIFVGDVYNTYPSTTRSYLSSLRCAGIWTA